MIKRFFLLLSVFLLLFAVSCEDSSSFDLLPPGYSWMSRLEDSRLINSITIPGTHDTCANFDFAGLSYTAAAQSMTLKQQLHAGVRCVDIRISYDGKNFNIHHGPTYQFMKLEDVYDICYSFLEEHPSEFIVFSVMGEYKSKGQYSDITAALNSECENNPQKWIRTASSSALTLGEVRGKLLLVYRDSIEDKSVLCGGNGYFEYSPGFKTTDIPAHWNEMIKLLDNMKNHKSLVNLNAVYLSAYFPGQFGIPHIRMVSSYVNENLLAFLASYKESDAHFGIIVADNMSKEIAHAIYSVNKLL